MATSGVRGGLRLNAHKERSTGQPLRTASPAAVARAAARSARGRARSAAGQARRASPARPADCRARRSDQRVAAFASVWHRRGDRAAPRAASTGCALAQHRRDERRPRRALRCVHADARSTRSRPEQLRETIGRGGIVGLGGAVFPTAAKLNSAAGRKRLATADQRRGMRALHQLRRHADARARRRCRVRRAHSAARAGAHESA